MSIGPRVAVGGFALESVSFLPQQTGVEDFEREARRGGDLIDALSGTASVAGGFLAALEAGGAQAVPLVHTDCSAAGPASDAAFERFRDELLQRLADDGALDGVLLFLHGAMTTPARPDPEGDLLTALRAQVGPDLPVMVAFDLHANLSPRSAALCDALFGFHFSPHVDMAETGMRAARCLLAKLEGRVDPQLALVKVPLVLPSIFTATALAPLSDLVARSLALPEEVPGIIDASIFCGFAYADTPDIGFSVAVVANGDKALAQREAERLASEIWRNRAALLHDDMVHNLSDGIAVASRQARRADRPVVVLEHADRLNNSTWCLRRLLNEAPALAVHCPYFWDPAAVEAASAAGVGARVSLVLGHNTEERAGGPLAVEAEILWVGEKRFAGTGPMRRGRQVDLGPAALLRIGRHTVSVVSVCTSAIDLDALEQFGIDFAELDVLLLRSKTHFRAVFEPLAASIVIVDTPDWGTADLSILPYRHVPAGIYPLGREAPAPHPDRRGAPMHPSA
ncbi:M81 family metallopeptidase [Pelagibius sp.]|uniref:M81 family metallopeptidase n=1 Tax=Pelagibius sp. TaxID=1931238 RepID=UPI0026253D41|nr:M81 family metallopeptidase [Pelagibius sp.]